MFNRVPNINEFNIRYVEPTEDENVFIGHCTNNSVKYTTSNCYDDNGVIDYGKVSLTIDVYSGSSGNLNNIYLNAINYIGLDTFDVTANISPEYFKIYQVFLYKDRTIKKVLDIKLQQDPDTMKYLIEPLEEYINGKFDV